MRTLRAQVTALLVVALVVVIALANGASFFLTRPDWPPFEKIGEAAQDVALLADLAASVPSDARLSGGRAAIQAAPPEGEIDGEATRRLGDTLGRLGRAMPVRVYQPGPGGPPMTAVGLADGRWLVLERRFGLMPPPGPPGGTFGFATWLAFMLAGVTLVVVIAVRRLTKPLSLIEEAARGIGPDGELPVLPEEGPAEVRAAAAAINLLSARLKVAMDSRMRIVAGAAHDLRTPLTRMRLRAEFIADDEERAHWLSDLEELDRIADSAIRLVREEVEGGPEEEVRFDDLVEGVVAEVAEARRPVRLAGTSPVAVRGRPLSLKRAVRNLIVNAATHGGGARVAVSAEAGRAVLIIEDDGPGIPEALMGQVFEPFFRVDPARQVSIPGAGLGLAIANEIVSRHGGRLTLANRPGGGLLQRVDLPGVAVEA
ncbi:two-component sensor histidine kinase [Xanthobacter autotrophicus]|uniref:ATP-binding protein n=1 Tax=Xanthobacter TaxID=279 RepID=UPI0024AB51D0|nr:ATP-binding protein [Xanthobacter autotrophicus]MDI4665943.1 two-component sensor histidine kinase [Xanthobacter autotrophicus]